MITGVVSCPTAPLLLPGLTGEPVSEVERLRSACLSAIGGLLGGRPDRVVLVGGDSRFGDEVLSIAVGTALLVQAGCETPVESLVVAERATPDDCRERGRELAAADVPTGLLVLADGSARRSVKAPGYLDDRAAPFDAEIERALRAGDAAGLAALDPDLAEELLVAGRAPWQVLAGAVRGHAFDAETYYSDDPFGVWYPVVRWLPTEKFQ